ncbi:MAG: peptidylprolyl isomerase [bacterium]
MEETEPANVEVEKIEKLEEAKIIREKSSFFTSRGFLIGFFVFIILLLASPFVATAMDLYYFHWHNQYLNKIATSFPFPAIYLDGRTYTVADYELELDNLGSPVVQGKKVVERSELRKMFLERIKRNAAVKIIVAEKNIDTTEALKIAQASTFGPGMTSEKIAKSIKDNFNWTVDYFNENIQFPRAREMAYSFYILKPMADEIAAQVRAPKANFTKIAKEKGEDATKELGGDLGWLKKKDVIPEFGAVLVSMKKGEISGPFLSRFGWHILKLVDIREKAGVKEYRASHIIILPSNHKDIIDQEITKVFDKVKMRVLIE